MGLFTPNEGNTLVELLLKLPGIINPTKREALIGSLPPALQQSASLSASARNDIRVLVNLAEGDGARLGDGRWPVELVIRQAISDTEGLKLAEDLQALLDQALARQLAAPPKPAVPSPPPSDPLTLSPPQVKSFQEALLSAFASYNNLEQMVYFGLSVSLDQITGERQMSIATYELIRWAVRHGRAEELIRAAREANPGNPHLRAFAQQVLGA